MTEAIEHLDSLHVTATLPRGSLTSVGSPRATLVHLVSGTPAPSPTPNLWQ